MAPNVQSNKKAKPTARNSKQPGSKARVKARVEPRQERNQASSGLSPDGSSWLTAALDPFHDFNLPLAGYPDMDASHTVVQTLQYNYDISKPAGSAGNWDLHIFSTPMCRTQPVKSGALTNDKSNVTTLVDIGALGPMGLIKGDTGCPLFVNASPFVAPANWSINAMGPTDELLEGCSRIIGWGFEVFNTTAEMYRQGTVSCYRLPQEVGSGTMFYESLNPGSAHMCRAPPSSAAYASMLKGTTQWEAAKGCYVPVLMSKIGNPIAMSAPSKICFTAGEPVLNTVATVAWDQAVGALRGATNTKINPYNTSGAIFTGLSNQTTLRVRIKMYIEKAPGIDEMDLASMATPSAAYDVAALQLYSKLGPELPVATMAENNANGDWFKSILRRIHTFFAPIAKGVNKVLPGFQRGFDIPFNFGRDALDHVGKFFPALP